MSMNPLFYGLIFFSCECAFAKASGLSPIREDANLRLFNPAGHELEQFEYAAKRDSDSPEEPDSKERRSNMGSSFIRFGRSRVDGILEPQGYGYNLETGDGTLAARTARSRSDNIIRFGRSSPRIPNHKIEQGRVFERIGKSGSSVYARLGRNVAAPVSAETEMAFLCSNILIEEDAHGSKDLQLYLAKLAYLCNNYNNNGIGEENSHRNADFVEETA